MPSEGERWSSTHLEAPIRQALAQGNTLKQVREVVLGDGYGSQNALRLHFGLNDRSMVDELIVTWPVRTVEEARRLTAWGVHGVITEHFETLTPALEQGAT